MSLMLLQSGIILWLHLVLNAALDNRELTLDTFDKVINTKKLVAVKFYAPWCGHCQSLAPEWEKVASSLDGIVTMVSVNCNKAINQPLCKQQDITGYPTIKIFHSSKDESGLLIKKQREYLGPREAKHLRDYLLARLPSQVLLIKADATKVKSKSSVSLHEFMETGNSTLTKAILFTDKPSTPPLFKALSLDFGGRMLMGKVRGVEKKVMNALGVTKVPSLLVITPGEKSQHLVYDGKVKYRPLYDYLSLLTLESGLGKTQSNPELELLITPHNFLGHDEL